MRIAVIGTGSVGGTLGKAWASRGHTVVFGSRRPEDAEIQALAKDAGATASQPAEAAATSEVVVLATPWEATQKAIAGLGDLRGKILLDATNPLLPGLAGLDAGMNDSGGERVARWASGARVVKIFNTTGFGNMADPAYGSERATMFYCGDDADAKGVGGKLASDLGFQPEDVGPLSQARYLEPLAMLWITMAVQYGYGRDIAFRLMRR